MKPLPYLRLFDTKHARGSLHGDIPQECAGEFTTWVSKH